WDFYLFFNLLIFLLLILYFPYDKGNARPKVAKPHFNVEEAICIAKVVVSEENGLDISFRSLEKCYI
ncbi:MAG: hypothetical protein AAFO82_17900, partial [Bacteroidota bacterium]